MTVTQRCVRRHEEQGMDLVQLVHLVSVISVATCADICIGEPLGVRGGPATRTLNAGWGFTFLIIKKSAFIEDLAASIAESETHWLVHLHP